MPYDTVIPHIGISPRRNGNTWLLAELEPAQILINTESWTSTLMSSSMKVQPCLNTGYYVWSRQEELWHPLLTQSRRFTPLFSSSYACCKGGAVGSHDLPKVPHLGQNGYRMRTRQAFLWNHWRLFQKLPIISRATSTFLQCSFSTGDLNHTNHTNYHVVLSYCLQIQAEDSPGVMFPDTATVLQAA